MPRIQGGEAGEPVPQPRLPQLRQDRAHMPGGQGGEERVRRVIGVRGGVEQNGNMPVPKPVRPDPVTGAAGLPTESA